MKKGSLFTGVGGADIGAEKAGMIPVWYCEIDHSAAGVIAEKFKERPIYCDITKFNPDRIRDAVDVIFGGSPCQDLSVAGKRQGLDGKRSRLFFEMVRVLKRLRPGCFVWENVPGALSSHGARDFARVLRSFTGLQVEVPPDGWGTAGFIRTPFPSHRWHVAWRVLDSQYFGVPQRRRRVFIVGSLGDGRCAEILFEPESVQGHPPPRRGARQDVAPTIGARSKGGGGLGTDAEIGGALIAASLTTSANADRVGEEANLIPEVARCLSTSNQRIDAETETFISVTHTLRGEGFDASEDGTGRGTPLVAVPILEAGARTGSSTEDPRAGIGIGEDGDPMFALQATKQHAIAFSCKDDAGDASPLAPTLRGMADDGSHDNGGVQIAVAFNLRGRDGGAMPETSDVASLRAASGGSSRSYVSFSENTRGELRASHVSPSLTGGGGKPGQGYSAAVGTLGVRRLTPRECERLQGWPDDHTRFKRAVRRVGNRWVPGDRLHEQADGPRYKQCGNGVTATAAEWISKRMIYYQRKKNPSGARR